MFYKNQSEEQKAEYIKLLQVVGSLSNLFSESRTPNLYYRAAENIFCKALQANNLSRGDISFDAFKGDVGIGLKTFMHGNGKKYEKIAEFNKDIEKFRGLDDLNLIMVVSKLRNQRIEAAQRAHDTDEMIYHLVTRKDGNFEIYEEEMHLIDFDSIRIDKKKSSDKNIFFRDKNANYKFYIAKSTLYKQFFTTNPQETFEVEILDDPFEFLLSEQSNEYLIYEKAIVEEKYEQIILPLYSAKSGDVEQKSGLNQWNARGRSRDKDEVYIPIPAWIHRQFEGFFPYNRYTNTKEQFKLILPNNVVLDAKITQGGGKGFMSNPNKALGHWILRTVLQVPAGQLVTYEDLDRVGIDSVLITKYDINRFKINFASKGSYSQFEDDFRD
ncbi:restriction endonuclease [Virgibacillus sp. L01]|uniref:restriction endonuclease n=1 Tax=Virgibacillus sp. L01 TaxID=3457429 RepID=UPI003FD5D019